MRLQLVLLALDGTRPSATLEWVSAVAPALTQAAVGAGHWASGRRQRALAAWACAAGSGLVAWGLGTEAPTRAELVKNTQQHRDLLRKLDTRLPLEAPATAGTQTHPRQRSQNALSALACAQMVFGVVFGVRSGLRHPRQLTVHAIASETFRDMVDTNEEGTVARDEKTLENYVFDDATIESLLTTEAIAPSGAACLTLAMQHRKEIIR